MKLDGSNKRSIRDWLRLEGDGFDDTVFSLVEKGFAS
jgi:hypothetical protein